MKTPLTDAIAARVGWKDLNPGIAAIKHLPITADGKAWFTPWERGDSQSDNIRAGC